MVGEQYSLDPCGLDLAGQILMFSDYQIVSKDLVISYSSSKYVVSHKHKHFVLMLGRNVVCSAMLPPAESIRPPMLSNGDFFAVTIGSGAAVVRAYKHALTHSKQLHIYYWSYRLQNFRPYSLQLTKLFDAHIFMGLSYGGNDWS